MAQHHAYIHLDGKTEDAERGGVFIAGGSEEYCNNAVAQYIEKNPGTTGYVRPCTESELK